MSVTNSTDVNFIVAKSVASTFTSDKKSLSNFLGYSIQLTVTGGTAPTGTFELKQSNDGVNFISFATPITQAITAAGSWIIGDSNVYYNFVEVVYTYTSGTGGTVSATFVGKSPS